MDKNEPNMIGVGTFSGKVPSIYWPLGYDSSII
jgi:hypothetical protein